MLSIKIIAFGIAAARVVGVTRWSSSSNLDFIILVTKCVIFDRSNDSLYNQVGAQNCSDFQTYSNAFGVTVANSANVGTLKNVSFK